MLCNNDNERLATRINSLLPYVPDDKKNVLKSYLVRVDTLHVEQDDVVATLQKWEFLYKD